MKKRTAFIGAILSLIPLGQPLLIKTGVVLSTAGLIFAVPEKVYAGDNSYYFDRAYEKGENGDNYGAISDYTKALEIDPNDAEVYYNRGWNKSQLKDYYGAISDYTKAIEINPQKVEAYKNRGIAKEEIGDLNGACSDWRQTVFLSPNDDAAKWVRNQC